jgi:nitrate reductase beta subunit
MNAACVAACPSGAGYKREEDGIVLIDQNRCRAWRYCISSCPYKKTYFNWRTGKMEKCILCYPRLETGQPPACFHACPGRIRYLGPLLYDMDRVPEAANAPVDEIVEAQREIILDPNDPEVVAAARDGGISEAWIDAARRSPVYRMVKDWEIALPLHPEFRTLPSLFYVPPESPVRTSPDGTETISMIDGGTVLPTLEEFRIPIRFLASLFSAGKEQLIRTALLRQLAVRSFRRSLRVDGTANDAVMESVGLTAQDARDMHRMLSLGHFHERYVIPTTRRERTANAPYIERGFSGFSELQPAESPKRRSFFHGGKQEVGS